MMNIRINALYSPCTSTSARTPCTRGKTRRATLGCSHPPRRRESIIKIFLEFSLYCSAGLSASAGAASSFFSAGALPSAEGSASDEVQRV
jgi:hypothetical protein